MCRSVAPIPARYEFLTPLYKRVRIADAVEALKDADLVGFSTYVWNGRISLEIARRLKAAKPGIVDRLRRPARARPARGVPARQPADRPRRPQRGRAHLPEASRGASRSRRLGSRCRASASSGRTARFVRNPNIDARARPRRDPLAVPRRRVRRDHGGQSAARAGSACGRPIAAARSAAPSATGARPPPPRSPSSARSGSSARSTGSPRRRSSTSSAATPTSASRSATSTSPSTSPTVKQEHRLSRRALGAEHQERDRARLRDAEDPVRRRPEQGRGALDAERRHDDARGDQARQHLARHLHGAAAPLHARPGRDLLRPDPRPARRDLRIVRAAASTS